MVEIQTRSEENGMSYFDDIKKAFDFAEADTTVWKISFSGVRLVRYTFVGKSYWKYEPMDKIIEEVKNAIAAENSGVSRQENLQNSRINGEAGVSAGDQPSRANLADSQGSPDTPKDKFHC